MEKLNNNVDVENITCSMPSTENDFLIDPEPFSIFLGILGFLGSVASLAGYIEFKKQQKNLINELRSKTILEIKDLLMSLEVDTMQIETSLRKLEFILEEGSEHNACPFSNLKLQFGTCKPIFTLQGYNKFGEISLELNRLVGKSFEVVSKLLQKLYNINITFGNNLYNRLIELQNKLNAVLRKDLSYQEGFRVYYEIIVFTKELLREIRLVITNNF